MVVGLTDGFGAGLGEDRGDQRVDGFGVRRAQVVGDVAGEVDPAALPAGAGSDGLDCGFRPGVGVADDQCHPFVSGGAGGVQAALAQAAEELGPEVGRFAVCDGHAQDLAASEGRDSDRDHDRLGDDMALLADVG